MTEFAPAVDPARALEELTAVVDGVVDGNAADACDVFLTGRVGQYTRFAGGRIHQPQDITEVQVMVRAIVNGHAARAACGGLAGLPAAARTAARSAAAIAASVGTPGRVRVATPDLAPDEHPPRPLGGAEPGCGGGEHPPRFPADALLVDDATAAFDTAERVDLVRAAHAAAAARGGSVAGMVGRALTQLVVATSTGIRRATLATEAQGGFTFEVGDGTAHVIDLGRAVSRLGLRDAIDVAAAQAAASVGRVEAEPGEYTVVLGPEATAELVSFLPAFGFSGELAAAGVGVCARGGGERAASALVSVADDALAGVGLPIGFDIEGVTKRRVVLLDKGIVGSPVTDLSTAAALGVRSSGHAHIAREEAPATRAANLVMAAGGQTEASLIADVPRGVYLQRFWYTRLVDRAATTITGVTRDACFEIVDGALGRPLAGMRFTQPVLELLSTVDGVGDRRRTVPVMNVWNGATTAPAIRAHGFRLGAAPASRNGTSA
jgi:predicted Zn-dependent protease